MSSLNLMAALPEIKGFIKSSIVHSNHSILSFANDSMQAPTEVANLWSDSVTSARFKQSSKTNFEIAQSRLGLHFQEEQFSGIIEIDFTDFTANPIAKNGPRLRIAELIYEIPESLWSVRTGQGWSTWSALAPHTYNFVGGGFRAGNSGFLSQFAEIRRSSESIFVAFSLAQKGRNITGHANPSAMANPLQQNESNRGIPLMTLKFEGANQRNRYGVIATYAKFDLKQTSNEVINQDNHIKSQGAKVYALIDGQGDDYNWGEIKAEAYWGTNLNDLLFLTLADRSISLNSQEREHDEIGGFVSWKKNLTDSLSIHTGYGQAKIISKLSNIVNGKVVKNQNARFAVGKKLTTKATVFAEIQHYATTYLLDQASEKTKTFDAQMLEVGLVYAF